MRQKTRSGWEGNHPFFTLQLLTKYSGWPNGLLPADIQNVTEVWKRKDKYIVGETETNFGVLAVSYTEFACLNPLEKANERLVNDQVWNRICIFNFRYILYKKTIISTNIFIQIFNAYTGLLSTDPQSKVVVTSTFLFTSLEAIMALTLRDAIQVVRRFPSRSTVCILAIFIWMKFNDK